ncbi:uncharacterized protein LOC118565129 [Fundulus heteroclitus]|uniref:uncharacterized protein LOC118565129 n=1 Tax=Fundulus heteroclitus TaxID=8078 RepID=UPI00165B92B7|nr:uncharacterized protein LOC118565129 [Fundulus heteroclitus]
MSLKGIWQEDNATDLLNVPLLDFSLQGETHAEEDMVDNNGLYHSTEEAEFARRQRTPRTRGVGRNLKDSFHSMHSMTTRSQGPTRVQMPILQNNVGTENYVPYSFGDVQALVDKLPSIAAGGRLWLAELDNLTKGTKLALGDFRAVLGRCVPASTADDIEYEARTSNIGDETLFSSVITRLGNAIREHFPLSTPAAVPKFDWDPLQHPKDFITQAEESWIKHTGVNPKGDSSNLGELFREAVLKGVPPLVSQLMKQNPEMPGCEYARWEKHLVHHLHVAQDVEKKKKQEKEDIHDQLIKLQLLDAKRQVNQRKQEKTEHVMVSAVASPGAPSPMVTPQFNPMQGGGIPPPVFYPPCNYRSAGSARGFGLRFGGRRGRSGGEIVPPNPNMAPPPQGQYPQVGENFYGQF